MIAYSERTNETSQAGSRPRSYSTPTLEGERYAVVQCGPFYEVRLRRFEKGRLKSDQLVCGLPNERDADATARFLTEKGEQDAVYSFID